MATIREFLERRGFDWNSSTILVQDVKNEDYAGWREFKPSEGHTARYIEMDDEILDKEFYDDYGGAECPRFVARDFEATYFPCQYDGATWCDKVYHSFDKYLVESTPYPGGG